MAEEQEFRFDTGELSQVYGSNNSQALAEIHKDTLPKGTQKCGKGCGGHGQGFTPVTEALGWFLPPDSDCKWRTDAAQLQHPGEDMPTAKQLADIGYKTFSASLMLLTVYGGYLCSVRAYQLFPAGQCQAPGRRRTEDIGSPVELSLSF